MSFTLVESWEGRASPLAPEPSPPAIWPTPAWAARIGASRAGTSAARGAAMVGAVGIGIMVIAALTGMLDRAALVRIAADAAPLVVRLEPLTPPRTTGEGAARPVPQPAATPTPPSPIETSTPTPVSRGEWSVTRIPIIGPRRTGTAGAEGAQGSGTAGSGQARGPGGTGAYDPYAGAAPQFRGPANGAAEVDRAQIDRALAAVKPAFPAIRGPITLRLRLSSSGMLLELWVVGIADDGAARRLTEALRTALIGRRLARVEDGAGGAVIERTVSDIML